MLSKIGIFLLIMMMACKINAITYELPSSAERRLIGQNQYHVVQAGQTLAKIAKENDVGMLALMAANPGVDPFLPDAGTVLTLPLQLILPDVPYEGIVINLAELRLYYFQPEQRKVHVFPVGIGRIGRDTPEMYTQISQKRERPTWTPPASIRAEYREKGIELPQVVPAGDNNPLGHYAMRLAYGQGEYLIHGTNKTFGVGMRVSAGCLRLEPDDIEWLFSQVAVGEKVRVINEPIKFSLEADRRLFIEVHEPLTRSDGSKKELALPEPLVWWLEAMGWSTGQANVVVFAKNGYPIEVKAD